MQAAANLHQHICKPFSRVAENIFHDATAFDAADDVLDSHAHSGNQFVHEAGDHIDGLPTWLFLGLKGQHAWRLIALKARVFEQRAVRRKGNRRRIAQFLIVVLALSRVAQKDDALTGRLRDDEVLVGVRLFLPL